MTTRTTILITGANGFIGRHLVKRLLQEDYTILALVRNQNIDPLFEGENVQAIVGDLLDPQSLAQIPPCEAVFHLAGTLDHTLGAEEMIKTNHQGTLNILEFCKKRKVKKLIHLSTLAIMCDGSPLIDLTEKDSPPSKQIGTYATSKAMAEKALLNCEEKDVEICIVRPPFVWGDGDRYSLPKIVENVNKKIFSWIDDGNYLFSTCHVENLAEGLLKTYQYGKDKQVYYFQDKERTTIKAFLSDLIQTQGVAVPTQSASRGLIKMVCNVIELPWKILPLKSSPPTHLRETLAHLGMPVSIGSDKAKKELNYTPVIDRETGMSKIPKYCL